MSSIYKAISEASDLWLQLTGLDPDAKTIKIGDLEVRRDMNDVAETLVLDDTGITAYLLLRAYVPKYAETLAVTLLEIARGLSPEAQRQVDLFRQIDAVLNRPDVADVGESFSGALRRAGRFYGLPEDTLSKILANPLDTAVLRRDALRSYRDLEKHQFAFDADAPLGDGATNPCVYQFWNMDGLVSAMRAQRIPGVTLCLVRDPMTLRSFFAIAIANRGTLTVLTDRPKDPHPDAKHMVRRPDRELLNRADRNWFPYELLNLWMNENGVHARETTALTLAGAEGVPLARVAELKPEFVLWWSMILNLIQADYFHQNRQLEALSYTPAQIQIREAPETSAPGSLIVLKLRNDAVTAETVAEQWDSKPRGHNEWMIARYGPRVPEEALNAIGMSGLSRLLPAGAEALIEAQSGRYGEAADVTRRVLQLAPDCSPEQRTVIRVLVEKRLRTLESTNFGTAADLNRDRLWIARRNQVEIVQALAEEEFDRTVADILHLRMLKSDPPPGGWYWDRVQEKKERILEILARGEFFGDARFLPENGTVLAGGSAWAAEGEPKVANLVTTHAGRYSGDKFAFARGINLSWQMEQHVCPVSGSPSLAYHAMFAPQDGHSIAALLQIPFEELPWQIQHWTASPLDHPGNHILDRLDPSDWVLENPWVGTGFRRSLDLTIRASFSKRGVNQVRKRLGLQPIKWQESD